jgi:hypothetical protein
VQGRCATPPRRPHAIAMSCPVKRRALRGPFRVPYITRCTHTSAAQGALFPLSFSPSDILLSRTSLPPRAFSLKYPFKVATNLCVHRQPANSELCHLEPLRKASGHSQYRQNVSRSASSGVSSPATYTFSAPSATCDILPTTKDVVSEESDLDKKVLLEYIQAGMCLTS